jgi:hypothetical protein
MRGKRENEREREREREKEREKEKVCSLLFSLSLCLRYYVFLLSVVGSVVLSLENFMPLLYGLRFLFFCFFSLAAMSFTRAPKTPVGAVLHLSSPC